MEFAPTGDREVIDAGLRARVRRLLGGECSNDDFTRLFLYARDRCDGRETIREIGDFVAHHSERTKGLITLEARDWYVQTRFLALKLRNRGNFSASALPPNLPEILFAILRRADIKTLSRCTGLRAADARKKIELIIRKLIQNPDGTRSFPSAHSKADVVLIQSVCGIDVVRPAFDGDKLFSDLVAVLKSNSLLEKSEIAAFERQRSNVALFGLSLMHNCELIMADGAKLKLTASTTGDGLDIQAPVPVGDMVEFEVPQNIRPDQVRISSAIYQTNLDPEIYCETSLFKEPLPWMFDLEVAPSGKLAMLG